MSAPDKRAVGLAPAVKRFGLDATDLDMLMRGDMLSSTGAKVFDALDTVLDEGNVWRENVESLLSSGDPDVIRSREGGGPEDPVMSLVLTVMRTRKTRDDLQARLDASRSEEIIDKVAKYHHDMGDGDLTREWEDLPAKSRGRARKLVRNVLIALSRVYL